mgnify:CR=1 FL=1
MSAAVWRFDAIGTSWQIESEQPLPDEARGVVADVIEDFDQAWSRFRADSLITHLAITGEVPAHPDARVMLDLLADMSDVTDGAINPLVGGSLVALGYDAAYSLRGGEALPAPRDWRDRLTWDAQRLRLDSPAGEVLDVGSLGKGRLVDRVLAALQPYVSGDVTVDASGDLAVRGASVRIGLEHPFDSSRAIGVWEVQDQALCASATTRRAWGEGLHHVLDARTGAPVRTVVATWAVAAEAMRADAAATALFFDGGAELCYRWSVSWVRMLSDGRVEYSPGCGATLFTAS